MKLSLMSGLRTDTDRLRSTYFLIYQVNIFLERLVLLVLVPIHALFRRTVDVSECCFWGRMYCETSGLIQIASSRSKTADLPTLAGGSARTLSRESLLILGDDRFQGENLDRTLACPLGISFLL